MDALPDISIRQKLDETPPEDTSTVHIRSRWEHPLTLLVIGFLFTGVLGTLISSTIQSRQLQRDRERQKLDAEHDQETRHYESSTKAIVDFSNALYLRYVRAGMLNRRCPVEPHLPKYGIERISMTRRLSNRRVRFSVVTF